MNESVSTLRSWKITASRLWKLVGPVEGGRVLDLGCGDGLLARFGPPNVSVTGVDYNESSVLRARKWCHEVLQQDLDSHPELSFGTASFDAVVAKDILEHVVFPQAVLKEIRRVLRPGGRLVASVPMEFPWVVWGDPTHVRGFTRGAACTLLEMAGFDEVEVFPYGGIPFLGRFGSDRWMHRALELPGARRAFGSSWHLTAVSRARSSSPAPTGQ